MTDPQPRPIRAGNGSETPQAFSTWPSARPTPVGEGEQAHSRKRRWIWPALGMIVLGILLAPLIVFAAVFKQSRANEAHIADAIVVLGAAQYNGVPSQVFRARLDSAYDLYQQGYAPLIVVTGGRMYGDQFTEAEAGKTYLVDRGIPADSVLMENVSSNTAASFSGVEKILKPRGVESLLIVSDGFHLYRSKMLARHAGFTAYVYAAADSPIRQDSGTELRYMVRETFGILAWRLHIKR